jgi:LysR family transcriptional regulator (chromosome initiation inhibitor)
MDWDLAQLQALATTVAEGSFDAAAQRLHVTPSAISQRIKALETSVGRVLVIRSRPVRPTPSGEALLRVARQIEMVIEDATRELADEQQQELPVVALAVNADSLSTWLPTALAAVDPPVCFDLRRADETRTAELLRDGTVTAAVTALAEPVPGCSVSALGYMRYRPRASPEFVERWFGAGVSAATLSVAPVVVVDRTDILQDAYLRRRSRRTLRPPRHHVPGSSAFTEAVRLGLGWGMVPDLQSHEGDGLVEIDPQGAVDVHLHWQQWRLRSATVERVADAVRAQAERVLTRRTRTRSARGPGKG